MTKCHSFENFNCKGLFVSSFVCTCVIGVYFGYWMTPMHTFCFFSWCVLKLLDSLSLISPDHYEKMQAVPLVYVAAKSFWRFYEVQAYITSSHSLQIEYWLIISSFGAARVWILIKHPNALHSQFQEKFMRSPWEIHISLGNLSQYDRFVWLLIHEVDSNKPFFKQGFHLFIYYYFF